MDIDLIEKKIRELQIQLATGGLAAHAALTGSSAHGAVSAPTPSQLMTRDGAGRAQVVAPSVAADIARKDTVDAVQTNLTIHTALETAGVHGSAVAATANKLIHRDASGRAQVAAPSAAADIARKDNVDTVQTNLNTHAALSGAGVHGSSVAVAGNTIPHRDPEGYLFGNFFNMSANLETSQPAEIVGIWYGGDGFLRKQTFAKFKEHLRDFIYPVGSYYTQYPDAASNTDSVEFPTSQRPETLFGGTWTEQWPTESVYFRTRGTLSDTDRASGKQEDQFQGHYHSENTHGHFNVGYEGISGGAGGTDYNWQTFGDVSPSSDGINGTPRTGAETRVVNRRIKVWKRTA